MKNKKTILAAGLLMIVLIWGIGRRWPDNREMPRRQNHSQPEALLTVANVSVKRSTTGSGIVIASQSVPVSFKVEGMLEKGSVDLRKGVFFRKGELLFQVDNREAFRNMNAKKRELKTSVSALILLLKEDFPQEAQPWEAFAAGLKSSELLPSFPEIAPAEMSQRSEMRAVMQQYQETRALERQMADYFFLAPFDGMFGHVSSSTVGSVVEKGKPVAQIIRRGDMQVKIIPEEELSDWQMIDSVVFEKNGRRLWRSEAIDPDTWKNELTEVPAHLRKQLSYGQGLTVSIYGTSAPVYARIPSTAAENGFVRVWQDGKIQRRKIQILEREEGGSLVVGLASGEKIVL